MKAALTSVMSLVFLARVVSSKTVFSSMAVNGVFQGQDVGVRVPQSNNPVTDLTSDDIICNTGFTQPVSNTVFSVAAGSPVTAIFHHTPAGYVGPDPADPIDPTDKGESPTKDTVTGPLTAYMAAVPSATQTDVTGLQWFKIWEDGLDQTTHQWGSDILFLNGGNATFTIPSCIASGQYLLRVEDIALQNAASYPGAQFYMSCAQIEVTGGGDASPQTVSFPGAVTSSSPGVVVPSVYGVTSYTVPGPAVFTC